MNDTKLRDDEILSPEGVEEKLIERWTFEITLTGGGKYRLYECKDGKDRHSGHIVGTLKEARKSQARTMIMLGMLVDDPKATIDMLFKSLENKNGGNPL